MKKITILFILIASSALSHGQSLNEKNLIGKWSVTKVTSPMDKMNWSESDMKEVNAMKKAFHNAVFEFKENGKFFSKFTVESSYSTSFKKLNGKNWTFDFRDEFITISDKEKEKEESEFMSFFVPAWTPISDVTFSIGGLITLHMKQGEIVTEIDY